MILNETFIRSANSSLTAAAAAAWVVAEGIGNWSMNCCSRRIIRERGVGGKWPRLVDILLLKMCWRMLRIREIVVSSCWLMIIGRINISRLVTDLRTMTSPLLMLIWKWFRNRLFTVEIFTQTYFLLLWPPVLKPYFDLYY